MKYLAIVVSLCVFAGDALADTTCAARAVEKKLAGAAQASFMKKCEEDAAAACDADSKLKSSQGRLSIAI